MLRMDGRNVNFNGASIVNDEHIASMSANISNTGLYFSISIENSAKYIANTAAVDADIKAFKEAVIDAI